jgi:hypothetical protein
VERPHRGFRQFRLDPGPGGTGGAGGNQTTKHRQPLDHCSALWPLGVGPRVPTVSCETCRQVPHGAGCCRRLQQVQLGLVSGTEEAAGQQGRHGLAPRQGRAVQCSAGQGRAVQGRGEGYWAELATVWSSECFGQK